MDSLTSKIVGNRRPTIILIPGAFHIPAHYRYLIDHLASKGFKVCPVHNPSTRRDPPWPNTYHADAAAAASIILSEIEAGSDVVLMMHSYGGLPGGAACKGLLKKEREHRGQRLGQEPTTGGVIGLIYLASLPVDEGLSLDDLKPANLKLPFREDPSTDGQALTVDNPEEFWYQDVPVPLQQQAVSLLRPWTGIAQTEKQVFAPWKHVPSTYIICTKDNSFDPEVQEMLASQPGGLWTIEKLASGHSPFLSAPQELAAIVEQAVNRMADLERQTDLGKL